MSKDRALVVLTPYESRRLIAKAVAKLPFVEEAMRSGWVIVATGSSTGYVAEELTGISMVKENFISGHITQGETWGTPKNPEYIFPIVLHKGQRQEMRTEEALKSFSARDVFIKGASAVDPQFHAAVFMGSNVGGTIGASIGTLHARGSYLLVPVGLEKLVPSVAEAAKHSGIMKFKHHTGMPVGLMPMINATIITEIQAFAGLFGLETYHIGSGGIAGSEGAVVLAIEGAEDKVEEAFRFVQTIKGEKHLLRPNGIPQQ
ncbi:MAG: hypothetical protein P4N59_12460 [Negativicutes bacterium]|nr:hypothetical protein [Negativicutes bacterium]